MKPLAPNTLLQNRYLIVQLIGKGGMGEVYLAVDQRLGSAIAIKRTFFSDDNDALGGAFEREARTLARLRHPVLPKVSDHFSENDNQYLVMEHISGDDLSKRLESNKKPFPVNWVLFWADQLLDALNYLHSHEPPIIHRDIKPQNLKLTDDNQIVLLDFGLAKDSVGQTKITTTGSVVGFTPHYAPMEQIRGTGTNPKSDLYALSATLYQLLTNTVPFDALTRADSLLNGVSDPVQPMWEINKEVPKPISEVILKGMSVSQEQRYATAREMQKILRDAYSSMQNQMTAQTIAFNLEDELKAAELATPVLDPNYATIISEPLPPSEQKFDSQPTGFDKTEVLNQSDFSSVSSNEVPTNFDATMKMDDVPPFASEPKQADVKTEVFLSDKIAEPPPPVEQKMPEEDFSSPADATVPLLNFDSQPKSEPINNFDSAAKEDFSTSENVPTNADNFKTSDQPISSQPDFYKTEYVPEAGQTAAKEDFSTAANTVATPNQFVREEQPPQRQPRENFKQTPPPVIKKKSGGKGLAVGAGLFALLLLLAGAGVGGWYVYNNYIAVAQPTPTPEISPSVQMTPELTPEPTLAETNTSNTNTDIAETGNTNSANTNTGETNSSLDNTRIAVTNSQRQSPPNKTTPPQQEQPPRQQPPRQQPPNNNPPRPTQPKNKPPVQQNPRPTDIMKP